jgi:hypothetical protein
MSNKVLKLEGKKYRVKETMQAVYDFQRALNNKDNKDIGEVEKEMLQIYYILKNANRIDSEEYDKFTLSWNDFNDIIIDNMDAFQALTEDEIKEENEVEETDKKKSNTKK